MNRTGFIGGLFPREDGAGHGAADVVAAAGRLHAEGRIQHWFSPCQMLAEFRASAQRMERMIGDLLDLTRTR